MRALRLSLVLFALFITAFGTVDAQEAEPLRIGGTLPGEIAWSPDGAHLLVAASDVTRLYRAGEWDAPLRTFPAALRATWVNMRVVELDGHRYEVRTGRAVETPEVVAPYPPQPSYNRLDYPSRRYTFETFEQYMEQRLVLKITDSLKPDTGDFELLINDIGTIHRVLFSPDERYVAILYDDGRMRLQLWDLESRQRLFEKVAYRGSTYLEIRFSIDSRTLVAVETTAFGYGPYGSSNEEHITIWDTATGEQTFTEYGYWSTPRYSPNKEWFAYIVGTYGVEAELLIWNGVELLHTGVPHPFDVRFDAQGDTLFALVDAVGIGVIQLDIADRAVEEVSTIPLQSQYYAFSEDNRFVLGQGYGNPPTLWNIETMSEVGVLDTEQSLNDVLFSPDSTLIAIDHKTFWDTETAEKIFETEMPVSLAPDWSWAAYWDGGELVMRDLTGGMTAVRQTRASPELGRAVAVDPLERWALFRQDEVLDAYSLGTGQFLFSITDAAANQNVWFSADGSHLAVKAVEYYSGWAIYEIQGDSISERIGVASSRDNAAIHPDAGSYAIYHPQYHDYAEVLWYEIGSDEIAGAWVASFGDIQGISYHPTQNWIAVAVTRQERWSPSLQEMRQPAEVYLIDVAQTDAKSQTAVVKLMYINEQGAFLAPSFSPAGRFLILSCSTNCVDIIDLHDLPESGSLMQPVPKTFGASRLAYNADESMVFVKDSRKDEASLHVWDSGHEPLIFPATGDAIALNGDGTLAATVIDDGIALWDVNAVRAGDVTPLAVYPVSGLAPTQLTFDADDRLIALEPSGVTVYAPLEVSR